MRQSDDGSDGLPAARPLPNYGRGALYGIGSALVAGVGWVILTEVSGEYNIAFQLAIGWFVGAAVKRGMGVGDRAGVGIALYGTLLGILLGTFIYLALRINDNGGTISPAGVLRAFFIAFREIKFLMIFVGFTAGACWIAASIAGEGALTSLLSRMRKKGGGKTKPPSS